MDKVFKRLKFVTSIIVFMIIIAVCCIALADEANQEQDVNPSSVLEMNLSKYVNYDLHDQKGLVVQFNLKTGLVYDEENNNEAITGTTSLMQLPEIQGHFPSNVSVIVRGINATGGQANYIYDNSKGILQITANNQENTSYNKDARDEYEIILEYPEECYTENQEERDLNLKVVLQVQTNNYTSKKVEEKQFKVTQNIGNIISSNIDISDIYNGYIKSNVVNGTTYTTGYKENVEIFVSKQELEDQLLIKLNQEYLNENSEKVEENGISFKKTYINKNELKDILGEEGNIKILKPDGTVIKEINKDTEENENGYIEINYEENMRRNIY